MTQITKYMCTVETKNYPVNSIRPTINRYSSIRKKFNVSEIANCLACYATVTLHKNNGSNVKLTTDNFRRVLLDYKNEIISQEEKNRMNAQARKNAEILEKIKSEADKDVESTTTVPTEEIKTETEPVSETESLEEFEVDPEDPDITDFSYIDSEEETTDKEDE